jgi:hypothetical protein
MRSLGDFGYPAVAYLIGGSYRSGVSSHTDDDSESAHPEGLPEFDTHRRLVSDPTPDSIRHLACANFAGASLTVLDHRLRSHRLATLQSHLVEHDQAA